MELGLDGAVPERLDEAGREVRVPVRRHDQAEVHEAGDEDLVVGEDASDVARGDGAVARGGALVGAQAGGDVGFFVGAEPGGLFGEVGQDEEEDEGDEDGEAAFEDEDL